MLVGTRVRSLVFRVLTVCLAVAALSFFTFPATGQPRSVHADTELGPTTTTRADEIDPETATDGFAGSDVGIGGGEKEGCWTWDESELGFLEKLNESRRRHDLRAVDLDPELSKVAQHHSYNMKTEQRLYHTPHQKLRERVTNWELLGENVGRGSEVDSLHRSFMESEPHRDVVLNEEFRYVGIGVSHEEHQMWVTILLEAREDPGTTMEMDASC